MSEDVAKDANKPKRMKQPHKQVLREQLRLAADTIIRQAAEIDRLRKPWWKRLFRKAGSDVEEDHATALLGPQGRQDDTEALPGQAGQGQTITMSVQNPDTIARNTRLSSLVYCADIGQAIMPKSQRSQHHAKVKAGHC